MDERVRRGGGEVTPKELRMLGWVIWLSTLPLSPLWLRGIGAGDVGYWAKCLALTIFVAPFLVALRLCRMMADRREKTAREAGK
jgi:hypothetical protein